MTLFINFYWLVLQSRGIPADCIRKIIEFAHHVFGRKAGELTGHTNTINSIVALSDGTITTGSDDYTVRWWRNNKCKHLGRHESSVSCLAALPERMVASGSLDFTAKIWQAGVCQRTLVHASPVSVVAFHEGNLASASSGRITVWSLEGDQIRVIVYDGLTYFLGSFEGNIVSADYNGCISIWATPVPTMIAVSNCAPVVTCGDLVCAVDNRIMRGNSQTWDSRRQYRHKIRMLRAMPNRNLIMVCRNEISILDSEGHVELTVSGPAKDLVVCDGKLYIAIRDRVRVYA